MLVYRLTVQRQKYFYSGEDIQNETRLHVGEERLRRYFFLSFFLLFRLVFFLVDLSRSISEDGRFLKTK